jgi:predicted ATPase
MNIPLTKKQRLWLQSRGGRYADEVFVRNGIMFIYMKDKEVHIPADNCLAIHQVIDYHGATILLTVKEI